MKTDLLKYLSNLELCPITKSSAGGGAGSIIKMEIEKGDVLFILYILCTWRIEYKNKIVATSADNLEAITGLVASSVRMLEGKVIQSIKINSCYDLCINLLDGFCLRVFCIYSYTSESDSNWELWIPDENLSFEITNRFEVKKGQYN